MSPSVMLLCAVATIAIFVMLLLTGKQNFEITAKSKFKLKQMFPFEMQNKMAMPYSRYVHVLVALFSLTFALFGLTTFSFRGDVSSDMLIATIILSCFAMMSLFFVDMNKSRLHVSLAIMSFGLCIVNYGLVANYVLTAVERPYHASLGYMAAGIAFILLCLLVNPKLYNWMYLEKHTNEKGEVSLSRPKYSILPMYEWGVMIMNIVFEILVVMFALIGVK